MKIFITGTAGFIGFHLAHRLLADGHAVIGYDGVTDYYDPALKRARLARLAGFERFEEVEGMLEDAPRLESALLGSGADMVMHLAAQAGVRYSIEAPQSYVQSNLVGTGNMLEAVRKARPGHFLFASTSSVYGGNTRMPFAETDRTDAPFSLYAATKKAGEAMVHSYAHLYELPATCFRFFTVYGPWGRPDMALFKFTDAILAGRPIDVYGHGLLRRDFTYIDDLVEAIVGLAGRPPQIGAPLPNDSLSPVAPFRVVNIGGGQPTELRAFIGAIEQATGREALLTMLDRQPGEMVATHSDVSLLRQLVGALPQTGIEDGVARFVQWYRHYYGR